VFGRAEESEQGLRASDNADGMDCREDKLEDEDDAKDCELNNGAQGKETKGLVNDYPGMAHQSRANSYLLEGAERPHRERSEPQG
jgi:hypothetical protein